MTDLPQSMRPAPDADTAELIQRVMAADELPPTVTLANADPYQAAVLQRATNADAELERRGAKR